MDSFQNFKNPSILANVLKIWLISFSPEMTFNFFDENREAGMKIFFVSRHKLHLIFVHQIATDEVVYFYLQSSHAFW
jgi:hypothetical protein